jgi:hypothetical protein
MQADDGWGRGAHSGRWLRTEQSSVNSPIH